MAQKLEDCSWENKVAETSEKLSHQRDELLKMCNLNTLSSVKQESIELLGVLSSSPYVGALPSDDISILVDSLIQLLGTKHSDVRLQQKAENWASVQLKNMTRLPTYMVVKHAYLNTLSIPHCLVKIIRVIEENMDLFKNQENVSRIGSILNLLCKMGIMALRNGSLPTKVVESVFTILQKSEAIDILNFSCVCKFFGSVSEKLKSGDIQLSITSMTFLLCHHRESLEAEVIALLSHSAAVYNVSDLIKVTSAVANSLLPQVCSKKPLAFQRALAIMESAWLNSEGHPGVCYLISQFVAAVDNHCNEQSVVCLFPQNVRHLVLLLSIPPNLFSPEEQKKNFKHFLNKALAAVQLGVCKKEELSMLMIMFPLYYQQLLTAATQQDASESLKLVRITWNFDKKWTDEELTSIAQEFCHSLWFS